MPAQAHGWLRLPQADAGVLLGAGRDFEHSWMIGNAESDVGAGRAAGCRTVKIAGEVDLAEAVRIIAEAQDEAAAVEMIDRVKG